MAGRDSINLGQLGLLGLIGFGVYKFVQSAKNYQRSNYYQSLRASIQRVQYHAGFVEIDLRIDNPNSQGIPIKSIVGDVYINKNRIGTIAHYGNEQIAPNSSSTFNLVVHLNPLNSIAQILNMLTGKVSSMTVRFVGSVNANNQAEPLQLNYKIS